MQRAETADAAGIVCPACQSVGNSLCLYYLDYGVIATRRPTDRADRVQRRCLCKTCGVRYTTWELRVARSDPLASYRAAQLLDKLQDLRNTVDAMRQILEAQLDTDHPACRPANSPPEKTP